MKLGKVICTLRRYHQLVEGHAGCIICGKKTFGPKDSIRMKFMGD